MTTAYIGLGANLGNPVEQVHSALRALDALPFTRVRRHSSMYRSAPWGDSAQPEYVNAVAEIATDLAPDALLAQLHEIEDAAGRVRNERRYGPRTLDLDLLVYGSARIRTAALCVPHPRISERAFVLVPLQEIAETLTIPGLGLVSELLAACDDNQVARLETETP